MAHRNELALRTAYDCVAAGDLQPMLDLLSDDIRWEVGGASPLAGTYEGQDRILAFFQAMGEQYQGTLDVQVREVLANDHRAIVLTNESASVDGQQLRWTSVHVYTLQNGTIVDFRSYTDDGYHAFWSARAVAA
jgi:ketosteroid isomerase-like protein